MGVQGERVVMVGTQYFMALDREEREEMEKQRRKASAEMQVVSLCVMVVRWSLFSSLLYLNILALKVLWSLNSLISNLVLLPPTKWIF
jgi:hypothetical protein